jgi:integrase
MITVSQYLQQYTRSSTKKSYLVDFRQFFTFIYPELRKRTRLALTELDNASVRYFTEQRDARNDIIMFRDSIQDKAPLTQQRQLATLTGYFKDNDIEFKKRFLKNLNGRKHDPLTNEKIPSHNDIRRICEYSPIHGKALILVLASSGMRIGEAIQLREQYIEHINDYVKIRIPAQIAKNRSRRISFLTPEATSALQEWLAYRPQYLIQSAERSSRHKKQYETDRIFPFSQQNFTSHIWKNALKKAELLEYDENTDRMLIRPHGLRKFFRLIVGRHGRDEAEALMGHQQGLHAIYAKFVGPAGEQRLEDIYQQAIPELCIYDASKHTSQLQHDLETQQQAFTDLQNKLKDTQTQARLDMLELKTKNFELDKHITELQTQIEAMATTVNSYHKRWLESLRVIAEIDDEATFQRKRAAAGRLYTRFKKHNSKFES